MFRTRRLVFSCKIYRLDVHHDMFPQYKIDSYSLILSRVICSCSWYGQDLYTIACVACCSTMHTYRDHIAPIVHQLQRHAATVVSATYIVRSQQHPRLVFHGEVTNVWDLDKINAAAYRARRRISTRRASLSRSRKSS